jgi:putative endonuclease
MMTNRPYGTIYTGSTTELKYRTESHRTKKYQNSFSARYNLDKLVWYQEFDRVTEARAREKQLKAGSRAKKVKLIEKMNPEWRDLSDDL